MSQKWIQEVSIKWIDRQIAKKKMPLKLNKFYKIFFLQVLECVITFDLFQWHFHVFCTFPSIHFGVDFSRTGVLIDQAAA